VTETYLREAQAILGTAQDGLFGADDLAALKELAARVAPESAPTTQPTGTKSLALRALEWSLAECERWGGTPVSKGRIADYFTAIQRDGRVTNWFRDEVSRGEHLSHCAAAFGFAEMQVLRPGEALPPHRAGAGEIERDAQTGLRPGEKWVDATSVRTGHAPPPAPGSAAVYDRPGGMHVERVEWAGKDGYRGVGANEQGGRWVRDANVKLYTLPTLRGFVVPA